MLGKLNSINILSYVRKFYRIIKPCKPNFHSKLSVEIFMTNIKHVVLKISQLKCALFHCTLKHY